MAMADEEDWEELLFFNVEDLKRKFDQGTIFKRLNVPSSSSSTRLLQSQLAPDEYIKDVNLIEVEVIKWTAHLI